MDLCFPLGFNVQLEGRPGAGELLEGGVEAGGARAGVETAACTRSCVAGMGDDVRG